MAFLKDYIKDVLELFVLLERNEANGLLCVASQKRKDHTTIPG
jgi:hypothetical protein